MTGVQRVTGGTLAGLGHIRQSIGDILTTPLGSRVMRRDYGTDLLRLVDRPVGQAFAVDVAAASAGAAASTGAPSTTASTFSQLTRNNPSVPASDRRGRTTSRAMMSPSRTRRGRLLPMTTALDSRAR